MIKVLTYVMLFAILFVMNWHSAQISEMRKRLQLSRSEFAKLLGVDTRTIYRWENGESVPSGSAEAALLGINQALRTQPDGLTKALAAIGAMAAMGGLGFMIYKLIEFLGRSPDER